MSKKTNIEVQSKLGEMALDLREYFERLLKRYKLQGHVRHHHEVHADYIIGNSPGSNIPGLTVHGKFEINVATLTAAGKAAQKKTQKKAQKKVVKK